MTLDTMNGNLFPMASVMTLATVNVNATPTDLTSMFFQYGVPTMLLGVLGWFTFWQEKQRNKREESQREFINSVIKELREENKEFRDKLFQLLDDKENG